MRRISVTDERHPDVLVSTENEPENNEERLIELASQGDHDAFNALATKYGVRLLDGLKRAKPELSHEDMEDIAQETWLAAYKHLKAFRRDCTFFSWIFRIGLNFATTHLRRRQTRRGGWNVRPFHDDEQLSHPATPCTEAIQIETIGIIDAALNSLPKNHKTILILRGLEGLSYNEIAELLGTSETTVKSRLNRARGTMFRRLEEAGIYI
jgi:RNA polymerase sigma-70 factor (ECF subfamily)